MQQPFSNTFPTLTLSALCANGESPCEFLLPGFHDTTNLVLQIFSSRSSCFLLLQRGSFSTCYINVGVASDDSLVLFIWPWANSLGHLVVPLTITLQMTTKSISPAYIPLPSMTPSHPPACRQQSAGTLRSNSREPIVHISSRLSS